MLEAISIRNFRSIESADIPLAQLTCFVGPNGAGKTSILRALSILLGDTWPTLRSFRIPHDFPNFEAAREIEIIGRFAPALIHLDALGTKHLITQLRLICRPYKRSGKWGEIGDLHVEFEPLGPDGEVPLVAASPPRKGTKPLFRPLQVTADLRDQCRMLFIDHRRNLAQHLPGLRGSILGKLLEPARRDFDRHDDFKSAYESALALLRTEQVKSIEQTIQRTAKRMLGFLGRDVGETLQVGFGFVDPANPFNSLRLEYREQGSSMPGEELGLGIQSAIVVGVFEAMREIGGHVQGVVIEEPEMYLHPQAQRFFHRLLKETSASGCQIVYATHSPIFADVNQFESLRLVRRKAAAFSNVSYVKSVDRTAFEQDRVRQKLAGRFDPSRNEVLFASRALLVEGHADRAAALIVAEKIGFDVDAEGVALVDCGGKNAIPLMARVCSALKIPFAVLYDEDIWPMHSAADPQKQILENARAEDENKRVADAAGAAKIYILKPSLEASLGIGRSAKDKPQRVVEALNAMDHKDIPMPLLDAVKGIRDLTS